MKLKNITTLAELEAEQEKLKMLMEVTEQEFSRSIGSNRHQLKDFMIQNVAIPAGAVGVGVAALNKLVGDDDDKQKDKQQKVNHFQINGSIVSVLLNLVQTYLLGKKMNDKADEIKTVRTSDDIPVLVKN